MKKYLYNRITGSIVFIHASSVYAALTWLPAGLLTQNLWLQFLLTIAANSLLIEMCIYFKLLRLNNWVVTAIFMLLTNCCGFTYGSLEASIASTAIALAIFMLFLTYKSPDDVGHTYFAFLSIGVISLFFIPILYIIPLLWLLSLYQLQSLNWRTWFASIFGILTPYWFVLPWFLHQHIQDNIIIQFPLFSLDELSTDVDTALMPMKIVVLAVIGTPTIIGAINFWQQSYNESIQTRLFFNCLQWIGFAIALMIILQPQYYNTLIRMMIFCATPFIAHFFSLTRSKFVNYIFFVTLVIFIVLSIVTTHKLMFDGANETILQLWNG